MVRCVDGTFYTGITTDVARRVEEHNSSDLAAKYTRTRRPVVLVYSIGAKNKSAASKLEARIKKSTRIDKVKLVRKHNGFLRKKAG
jgi:putative endonuclease